MRCIIAWCPWPAEGDWGECWFHSYMPEWIMEIYETIRFPWKFLYYWIRWGIIIKPYFLSWFRKPNPEDIKRIQKLLKIKEV